MSSKISVNPVGGFTLVELLIAMTVGLVVIGAAYQSFSTQRQTYSGQVEATEMLQNARAAVDFMARELRMVITINALDSTNCNSSITYTSVANAAQQRKFAWDNSDIKHPTLQYTQGGTTQPLAENVSCLTITRVQNLFTITLTARTDAKTLDRHDYRSITINADTRARCIQVPPSTACS